MLLSTNRFFENALATLGGCGNSGHVITLNVFLVPFYYNYDLLIYALVNLYYIIYRHVLCFHSVVFYELYLHGNFLTRGIRAKQGILILLYASTKLNFGFCELWFSVNLGVLIRLGLKYSKRKYRLMWFQLLNLSLEIIGAIYKILP